MFNTPNLKGPLGFMFLVTFGYNLIAVGYYLTVIIYLLLVAIVATSFFSLLQPSALNYSLWTVVLSTLGSAVVFERTLLINLVPAMTLFVMDVAICYTSSLTRTSETSRTTLHAVLRIFLLGITFFGATACTEKVLLWVVSFFVHFCSGIGAVFTHLVFQRSRKPAFVLGLFPLVLIVTLNSWACLMASRYSTLDHPSIVQLKTMTILETHIPFGETVFCIPTTRKDICRGDPNLPNCGKFFPVSYDGKDVSFGSLSLREALDRDASLTCTDLNKDYVVQLQPSFTPATLQELTMLGFVEPNGIPLYATDECRDFLKVELDRMNHIHKQKYKSFQTRLNEAEGTVLIADKPAVPFLSFLQSFGSNTYGVVDETSFSPFIDISEEIHQHREQELRHLGVFKISLDGVCDFPSAGQRAMRVYQTTLFLQDAGCIFSNIVLVVLLLFLIFGCCWVWYNTQTLKESLLRLKKFVGTNAANMDALHPMKQKLLDEPKSLSCSRQGVKMGQARLVRRRNDAK